MEPITSREVVKPCPMCGQPRKVIEFVTWPKLETGARPEAEHRSAQTPADWTEGSHGSDNIAERKDDE